MPKSKTNKSNNKNADNKTNISKENKSTFFKRKLHVWGKYGQTTTLLALWHDDPSICNICNARVFRYTELNIHNESNDKVIELNCICEKCLDEGGIIYISGNNITDVVRNYLKENAIQSESIIGKQEIRICQGCRTEKECRYVWIYFKGMPAKVNICTDCLHGIQIMENAPLPPIQNVHIKHNGKEKELGEILAIMENMTDKRNDEEEEHTMTDEIKTKEID